MAQNKHLKQFEQSLNELETIVDTLEKGQLGLEEALGTFEKGVKLAKSCQTALKEAEQKVSILTEKNGQETLQSLDSEEDNQ